MVWGPLGGPADAVGVWGRTRVAARGLRAAARRGLPVVTVEDAPLRSLRPRRGPAAGITLDDIGVHFAGDSRLQRLIAAPVEGDPVPAMAALRAARLSKYNDWADGPLPAPGFALVVDQVRGDAALEGQGPARAAAMLAEARAAHGRVLVRGHPAGQGHLPATPGLDRLNPWDVLERAAAVYVVSSQMGFEAVLAGHRPVVFGRPWYAGWGITEDRACPPRGTRPAEALFDAAYRRFPAWHDPWRGRSCTYEVAAEALRLARDRWAAPRTVAAGMAPWKRTFLPAYLRGRGGLVFRRRPDPPAGGRLAVWARDATPAVRAAAEAAGAELIRLEDGFLRSRGLGAALVPPASLAWDDTGIHYDPRTPSRLERLVLEGAADLPRAAALRGAIVAAGVTKYNLGPPTAGRRRPREGGRRLPERGRPRVLVVGQVADDASVIACGGGRDVNARLWAAAQAAEPGADLLWKPHPDVAAGLRAGGDPVDAPSTPGDAAALLAEVDGVWTFSSGLGFEALLRGVPVTTLGAPFYAGWGLTRDLGEVPARRRPVALDRLVWAALIAYPRYVDPVTRLPCPPELIVERLAAGAAPSAGPLLRLLRLRARLRGR